MLTTFVLFFFCAALILLAAVFWRHRAASNRERRAEREQFRLLAEVSPDGLLINRNGVYVYANPAAVSLLGAAGPQQIIGKTPFDIIHPDDHAAVKERYSTVLQGRSVPLKEMQVLTFDKRTIDVETMATCYKGPDGPAALVIMRDITVRKQTEVAMQEMNIALANAMPGIAQVNPDGRYLAVNDVYASLLGYDPPALIGENCSITVHPDSLPKAQAAYATMLREGKGEFDTVALRKDGSTFWKQVLMVKKAGREGHYLGHYCFMRDVTERKRAEQKTQRSEALLRQVIDTDPNFIFIKDRAGRFTLANQALADAYGTTVEGLLGKADADFNANADEVEQFHRVDLMVMDSLQEHIVPEERLTDAQGRLRWLQTVKRPFMSRNGIADFVLGVATDITGRKQSEMARQASDERFKVLVNGVKDYAIVMLGPDGLITTWNIGAERITGYREKEVAGQGIEMFYPDESRKAGHTAWLLAQAASTGSSVEEGWQARKDGTHFWASIVLTALYDTAGNLTGFAKITRDLTERKLTEELIVQSERRYRTLIETAGSAIVNFSPEGRIMGWNKAAEAISGWKRAEVMGKEFPDLCALKRGKEGLLDDMRQALEGESVRGAEHRFLARDGRERICSWNLDRLTSERGTAIGLIAVGEDITVRRQVETVFVEEKRFVESIMRSLPGLLYVFDSEGRMSQWNQAFEKESGYGPDEIKTMQPQDFVAPGDQAFVREKITDSAATGYATLEVELLRKDGSSCPFYFTWQALRIDGARHVIGIGIDIAERKQVEIKLECVNQRLLDMSARLEQVREGEQKRIARDLHDELRHQLTAMKLDVTLLSKLIQEGKGLDRQKSKDAMARLSYQLDATFSSVRKIARQVRPNSLDRLGLVPALEALVFDFNGHTGINASFAFDPALEELEMNDALNTTLYRIVQEALTNVARHSGATTVEVRLLMEDGGLSLDIEDNGKGFDESEYAPDRSLGVRGMQERVAMIEGSFSIVGRKGQGTRVSVKTKKGARVAC